MNWALTIVTFLLISCGSLRASAPVTAAPDEPFYNKFWREVNENLRVAADLSSRVEYKSGSGRFFYTQFAGVDLHKVVSCKGRDVGTAVVQLYLTRVDWPDQMKPWFFDSNHRFKLVPRIVTFNYTGLPGSKGRYNIKVGHFEIPFGLEYKVDTNGTLHQFNHGRNLGLKVDYGFTVNGVVDAFEYEVGLSRGAGIDYTSTGSPWLASGRMGYQCRPNFSVGLSGFYGEILNPMAVGTYKMGLPAVESVTTVRGSFGKIRRSRAGLDLEYNYQAFNFLCELTAGADYSQFVHNHMAEVNWRNGMGEWILYGQLFSYNQTFTTGNDHAVESKVGVQYQPDTNWDLSAQWVQQLRNFFGASTGAVLSFQVRYRT